MQHLVLTDPEDDALLANGEIPVLAPTVLSGSADAIPVTGPGVYYITTAGVDACTIATPASGGFGVGVDGAIVRIVSTTANAHTITAAANGIVPSHHLATFAAAAGSWIDLLFFRGLIYPLASSGVTIS